MGVGLPIGVYWPRVSGVVPVIDCRNGRGDRVSLERGERRLWTTLWVYPLTGSKLDSNDRSYMI